MATKAELQARCDELDKEVESLKRTLARMERELNDKLLPEELPPAPVPYHVTCWMKYHGLPWEVFWCYEHKAWCDELDTSLPFSIADNTCPECRGR